ncbi:sulfite dehydrogenase [Profundibacter sp.]|uniref:sulfite dehydrogenase n=1 Tax=Profundibacter sp. TaxID=3101071 RepID=UPI003D0CFD20
MPDTPDKTPSRRAFLTAGAAAGGAMLTAGPTLAGGDPAITGMQPWRRDLGDPIDDAPYGMPSPFEADVIRGRVEWLTPDAYTAINFTPLHELDGIITPNGLCFQRSHAGAAQIDPAKYRLMINGLVDRPLVFTLQDLMRFPRENRTYFLECAANSGMEWRGVQMDGVQFTHGMIHNVEYTGVPLRYLLDEGSDAAAMSRSIPLEKALDDCLVAFKMNGEALRPEQGYPVRLVVPGWEGNMWVKWLRRIEVGDKPWHHREESSKYSDLMADGRTRRFTWEMDAKSVITSPSPQAPVLHGKGPLVVSGLAWSGRGTIPQVDITLDGGINWVKARLSGPSCDKSLHRFYYEFDWDGRPLLLQSRAHDSTGYVQPTKDALRKLRGVNSNYHNNGIQTWHLQSDGRVENVEVS